MLRPRIPARTKKDQNDLDDLIDRMNGLDLRRGAGTSTGNTPRAIGSVQEVVNIEPTHDSVEGSDSGHERDVVSELIPDKPNDSNPVKEEDSDARPTDDAPKTNDAATDISLTPTLDTSNVTNSVEEVVTDTLLSGKTAVADDAVQQEEVVDLIPKDDLTKDAPTATSVVQNVIMWEVNKEVLKEVLEAKSGFSVTVQLEVRVADEVQG